MNTATLPTLHCLWGHKKGNPEWDFDLLIARPTKKHFASVREMAAKDGFDSFRESIDYGSAPDFSKTPNR